MNLSDFEFEKVISEDTRTKSMALVLKSSNGPAVVLLEKQAFDAQRISEFFLHDCLKDSRLVDQNDVYYRYINQSCGVEMKMIYPATSAHIAKYSEQERFIVSETPEMHSTITRPYFGELRAAGQIAWIENILTGCSETERRLVDDQCPSTGFVLLPDYKWVDESNVNSLYLLAIVRRNDLWSVRDLTAEHLPLLQKLRKGIEETFDPQQSRYKFPDGRPVRFQHLRIYFHYPPTYPHLHVHVTLAGSTALQVGAAVGQAILLDEVIDNLESIHSQYYSEKRSLSMQLGAEHALYARFSKNE